MKTYTPPPVIYFVLDEIDRVVKLKVEAEIKRREALALIKNRGKQYAN